MPATLTCTSLRGQSIATAQSGPGPNQLALMLSRGAPSASHAMLEPPKSALSQQPHPSLFTPPPNGRMPVAFALHGCLPGACGNALRDTGDDVVHVARTARV